MASTDGSEAGEHAVEMARSLAARTGARLEVLSVETAGLPLAAAVGDRLRQTATARDTRWVSGIPGFEIVHRAKESAADLVVLGRCARRHEHSMPLGRTVDTVIRRRDGACLLVPPMVRKLDRMVLAVDGTLRGLGILELAAVIAAALEPEAAAIHVIPDSTGAPLEGPLWNEPAVQRIQSALSEYPSLGGSSALKVRRGPPVPEILDFLEGNGADLLVLGVRRGGPCGEMGSGHIGQDLLRTAPVAILTIPI
jgi:nucleotide-binding universal stress UspA family protein